MSSSVLPLIPSRKRVPSVVAPLPTLRSIKLLDRLRARIRLMHYSRRTEDTYVYWRRAFIRFQGVQDAADSHGAHSRPSAAPACAHSLRWPTTAAPCCLAS